MINIDGYNVMIMIRYVHLPAVGYGLPYLSFG